MEENKNKKFEVGFADNKLNLSLDLNQDGDKLMTLKLNLSEAIQEVINRGDKVDGVKLVAFDFSLTKLKLTLDTDQDGEALMELEIDLAEALDEIGLIKK